MPIQSARGSLALKQESAVTGVNTGDNHQKGETENESYFGVLDSIVNEKKQSLVDTTSSLESLAKLQDHKNRIQLQFQNQFNQVPNRAIKTNFTQSLRDVRISSNRTMEVSQAKGSGTNRFIYQGYQKYMNQQKQMLLEGNSHSQAKLAHTIRSSPIDTRVSERTVSKKKNIGNYNVTLYQTERPTQVNSHYSFSRADQKSANKSIFNSRKASKVLKKTFMESTVSIPTFTSTKQTRRDILKNKGINWIKTKTLYELRQREIAGRDTNPDTSQSGLDISTQRYNSEDQLIYSRKRDIDNKTIKLSKWKEEIKEWDKDPQILIDLRKKIAHNREMARLQAIEEQKENMGTGQTETSPKNLETIRESEGSKQSSAMKEKSQSVLKFQKDKNELLKRIAKDKELNGLVNARQN